MSWYTDQQDRGVTTDWLPDLRDLETIAATPGVTQLMLPELPLVDEVALMRHANGVMVAVLLARQALTRAAAEPAAPTAGRKPGGQSGWPGRRGGDVRHLRRGPRDPPRLRTDP